MGNYPSVPKPENIKETQYSQLINLPVRKINTKVDWYSYDDAIKKRECF